MQHENGPSTRPYRLRTLGELRLHGPQGEVRSLRRKERVLLAYLVRSAPAAVRRAELAALLWGERDEARARRGLRQALFSLRRVLGDVLEVRAETVRADAGAVELDLAVLEDAVRLGDAAAALGRWGGDFLAGLDAEADGPLGSWIRGERTALRRLLDGALGAAVANARPSGRGSEHLGLARRWAEANPWDETAQVRMLEALRGAGRIEEAAAWHASAVERLRLELGIDPSDDLCRLGEELAAQRLRKQAAAGERTDEPAPDRVRHVGPDAAVAELAAVWRGVVTGAGAVVGIEGDAAATAAVCDRAIRSIVAASADTLVLRVARGTPAAGPWGGAAALLAPLRGAPGLSGVDDTVLADLSVLVPSIRMRFPRLPAPRTGDEALGRAASITLAEIAVEVPILIVADDAAVADAETRRWLSSLSARPPRRLLLLATGATGAGERDRWPGGLGTGPRCHRLRLARTEHAAASGPEVRPPERPTGSPRREIPRRPGGRRTTRYTVAAAGGVLLVALGLLGLYRAAPAPPVIAVGSVRALGSTAEDDVTTALPELLSTQLARVDGLDVVSRVRMRELLARTPGVLAAARLAGAGEVLEGELLSLGGPKLRLELRRIGAATGRVRETYLVEGEDAFDLAHRSATLVARSFSLGGPPIPERGPGSIAARALYEQGLDAYYSLQDYRAAQRLFAAALEQDPGFGMAAFFAANSANAAGDPEPGRAYLLRADALAENAPERDRLFLRAAVAAVFNDPAGLAPAESLAVRHPFDPSGPLLLGAALANAGRFDAAFAHLRRAIDMQPAPPDDAPAMCSACEAYGQLFHAYWHADSLDAAVRLAEEWTARQPRNAAPLDLLATALAALGKYEEAHALRRRAAALRPSTAYVTNEARHALLVGDYAAADAGLAFLGTVEQAELARSAVWLQGISFRQQGRYAEAWDAATRFRTFGGRSGPAIHPVATPQAVVLMETGHAARAAAMFDTMFHALGDLGRPSRTARDQAWLLTLQASALAAAGDTMRLGRLADSVQVLGARSAYGRDPRLHHHIRGLLLRARGDLAGAEQEFRSSIFSTAGGYTRSNVELASVLLERGRAAEAILLLGATLRAPLDGPALYVTRTEVYELLGRAFDEAGQPDVAAIAYRKALAALELGDPAVQPRREALRRRVAGIGPDRGPGEAGAAWATATSWQPYSERGRVLRLEPGLP
jgi:DNA-binding SARP family transcriptional activator/tetratricopeptide (TPR) repeat protein